MHHLKISTVLDIYIYIQILKIVNKNREIDFSWKLLKCKIRVILKMFWPVLWFWYEFSNFFWLTLGFGITMDVKPTATASTVFNLLTEGWPITGCSGEKWLPAACWDTWVCFVHVYRIQEIITTKIMTQTEKLLHCRIWTDV